MKNLEEDRVIARGLSVSHQIHRDGFQVGFVTRSEMGHYDAIPMNGERFDLPESQRLFGTDINAISTRLNRIGYTVVPVETVST